MKEKYKFLVLNNLINIVIINMVGIILLNITYIYKGKLLNMYLPKEIKIGCLNTFATKIIRIKVNKIGNKLSFNCLNLIYIRSFKCITIFINNSFILNGQNLHSFKLLNKQIIFSLKFLFLSKLDRYITYKRIILYIVIYINIIGLSNNISGVIFNKNFKKGKMYKHAIDCVKQKMNFMQNKLNFILHKTKGRVKKYK